MDALTIFHFRFLEGEGRVDKDYAATLRNKLSVYEACERTRQALHLTMIASNGLVQNEYAGLIQSSLTLDALFAF